MLKSLRNDLSLLKTDTMRKLIYSLAAIIGLAYACNPVEEVIDTPTPPVSDKALLKTCIMSSMHDIDAFESDGSVADYDLYMAVGETEHVQVKIYAKDYNVLEMKWAGLHPEIELQCFTFADFGDYKNEVLIPCTQAVPDSNSVVKLWLSFKVNGKAKTNSKYTENISFSSNTCRSNLKITIHTGDIILPETPSFPAIFGIYSKAADNLQDYSDFLLEHRISPYFFDGWGSDGHSINCTPAPFAVGTPEFWEYVQDQRFSAVALPYYNLSDNQLSENIAKAKELGIWSKSYYYLYDEPSEVAQFDRLKSHADKLHSIDADARVLTSFYREPQDGPKKGQGIMATFDYLDLGRSDIYCAEEDEDGTAAASYKRRLRDNQQWWSYVAGWEHPGISHHSTKWEHRAVMWRQYIEGPTGFLYWVVNWFEQKGAVIPSKNLDGQLVFPGSAFGTSGVVGSVRLMRYCDGLEECEMLKQYEQKHSRAEAESLVGTIFQVPCSITRSEDAISAFHKTLTGN